jgi:O-methyltransferase
MFVGTQLARRFARRRGWVRIAWPETGFDPEFELLYIQCRPYSMTSVERMYALWQAVGYVVNRGIPGAFVECGVWRGGSAMLAALRFRELLNVRDLYLYDTFKGMTEPGAADSLEEHARWRALQRDDHNDWCYASRAEVERNMLTTGIPAERLHLIEGPVARTLPAHAPERIAVLRLDTDFYESTRHELEHLYPHLSEAGVLIVDDYGKYQGARKAVDEYLNGRVLLNRIDDTGRLAVKI